MVGGHAVAEHVGRVDEDVDDSERTPKFQVVSLRGLVEMKMVSNLLKDQAHLIDMIQVGLIDETWPSRYMPMLSARLQHLLSLAAD